MKRKTQLLPDKETTLSLVSSEETQRTSYEISQFPLRRAEKAAGIQVVGLTVGLGSKKYRRQALGLAREAEKSGWFSSVQCITDDKETSLISALRTAHGSVMKSYPKGCGNWIWKPYIVNHFCQAYPDGTIIVYLDAGCELSKIGGQRFFQYLVMALSDEALFFSLPFLECNWTKPELMQLPEFANVERDSSQIQATWFMLKVGERTQRLVSSWLSICQERNYDYLLEDTVGSADLIEHRHDQSILSLLVKARNFKTIQWEDRFKPFLYYVNSWVFTFPVHATRARRIRTVWLLSSLSNQWRSRADASTPGPLSRIQLKLGRAIIPVLIEMKTLNNKKI